MKVSLLALCLVIDMVAQSESFEKRWISMIQQIPASSLDSKLPNRPFMAWFNELVGQDVGVVWQLAECGAPVSALGGTGHDVPACAEAIVILPNRDRLIVDIVVGTFKRGIIGQPAFRGAIIDNGERLYQVRRLGDLPVALRSPRDLLLTMPDLQVCPPKVSLRPSMINLSLPSIGLNYAPRSLSLIEDETPPHPPPPPHPPSPPSLTSSRQSRDGSGVVVEARVITRVKPVYPVGARSMNVSGKVDVRIVISEKGRVIEATIISGHMALQSAALEAALQWVYKPASRNGVPVKSESVLNFTFTPVQK